MKNCLRILLLCVCVMVFAVLPAVADNGTPLPKPDVLTSEEVFTSQRLSGYETIVIKSLDMEKAAYERVDDEERVKIDAMKPMLNRIYQESVEMELRSRKLFKQVRVNGEPQGKTVLLEGEMTEFNAGSRAMRFWIGFGAGKTYLAMKGRLVDAQSGTVLATFTDRETGYKGSMTMESYEGLFPHQAKSLGENVVKFIEKLY